MTDYVSREDYKARYGITVWDKDERLLEHITAASRQVDAYCGRSFGPHVGAATARTFRPTNTFVVYIDDAYDITAVAVDDAGDGTWSTAWTVADYDTDPANGIGPNGAPGWPVTVLYAIGDTLTFSTCSPRRSVQVTAKWGWPQIPDDVAEATYLLTSRLAYEVAVPGGVTPANLDFGIPGAPLQRPYVSRG